MRLIIFLLIASFIGAVFVYGMPGFLQDWLGMALVIAKHLLSVVLDFAQGFVALILRTLRELFGL